MPARPLLAAILLSLAFAGVARADEAPATPPKGGETSEPTAPTGQNCLGEPSTKLVMSNVLGIKWGGWGVEHQLRLGVCTPLVRKPGVLFDFSYIEGGLIVHTSPIYTMPGVYLQVAPLSILQFHLEAAPIFYWPIGVDAAGYYPLESVETNYLPEHLPGAEGQTALGWYVRFGPTVQAAISMGNARLIIQDSLRFERYRIGDADFYFHNKNDIPAANVEWFIDNSALVLVEMPFHPNAVVRLGANDQLTMNLSAQQKSNAVRGIAMVVLKRLGPQIRDFTPILALGGRTHHPVRAGQFNFIVALSFKVDMLAKKEATQEPAP